MAKSHVTSLMVLIFALAPRVTAQTAPAGATPDLHIAIAPAKDERGRLTIHHHKYFNVHLTNRSDRPIRLWDESCQQGHDTLNFRITDKNGNSWTMRKARLDKGGGIKDCHEVIGDLSVHVPFTSRAKHGFFAETRVAVRRSSCGILSRWLDHRLAILVHQGRAPRCRIRRW